MFLEHGPSSSWGFKEPYPTASLLSTLGWGELWRHGKPGQGKGSYPALPCRWVPASRRVGWPGPVARELRILGVQAGSPLWVRDFSEGAGEWTVSTGDPSPEPPAAHRH